VCSGCKTATYSSRDAQRINWKYHKKTCSLPRPDVVNEMKIEACLHTLDRMVNQPWTMNGDTVLIMKRIRLALENPDDYPGEVITTSDMGFQLHTMTRIFVPDGTIGVNHYSVMWAAPGMTEYLLNEDLYSKTILSKDDQNEEICYCEEDHSAREFAFLLFNLLVSTVIHATPSHDSQHDGYGEIRTNMDALVYVAAFRALELFLDPLVRESCEDALSPGCSLCLTIITKRKDSCLHDMPWSPGIVLATCFSVVAQNNPKIDAKIYAMRVLECDWHILFDSEQGSDEAIICYGQRQYLFTQSIKLLQFTRRVYFTDSKNSVRCERAATYWVNFCLTPSQQALALLENLRLSSEPQMAGLMVSLQVKIMRDAMLSVHKSCRGGVKAVFRAKGCCDKYILMHIAEYACDPVKSLNLHGSSLPGNVGNSIMDMLHIWWRDMRSPPIHLQLEYMEDTYNDVFMFEKRDNSPLPFQMQCMREVLPPEMFRYLYAECFQ
jgi:hypothetical protein